MKKNQNPHSVWRQGLQINLILCFLFPRVHRTGTSYCPETCSPLVRSRSRSPSARYPTAGINPAKITSARHYSRGRDSSRIPPPGQCMVMSTSNGNVFAIWESTNYLAGIYISDKEHYKRAKINTYSKIVTLLTPEEVGETPVGRVHPITKYFEVNRIKYV